jgi:hypothetical protein
MSLLGTEGDHTASKATGRFSYKRNDEYGCSDARYCIVIASNLISMSPLILIGLQIVSRF